MTFKYNIFFDTLLCNGLKSIHYFIKVFFSQAAVSFIPGLMALKEADSIPSGAAVLSSTMEN
jgi:hypothetical protein